MARSVNVSLEKSDAQKSKAELRAEAKQLVMGVGRMDETQLAENEDVVRTAMLYTVSYLYENRNTADFSKLTLTLRAMLFAQREDVI